MPGRKKILILVEWFAPGYKAGGPIQSCINLCIALKETYAMYVLTTDTDHGDTKPYEGIRADEWITEKNIGVPVFYARKESLNYKKIAGIINEIAPDFVYLNLFFSPQFVLYPLWLKFSRKINAKVVLCPRGTLYDSAISLKSYKKKPFIRLLKWTGWYHQIIFHATNEREKAAINHYFPDSKIVIADNLPNVFQPAFVSCQKIPGKLSCIFIARIVPIKNLLFVLELLPSVSRHISLTIVGPVENESYWLECKATIDALPENISVRYEGAKKNSALRDLLHQHHLFILPTTGENFGHAIFESLLAGRPVLISDQTPWLDLEQHNAGWAVALDDRSKYLDVISRLADSDQQTFDKYAESAWNYANRFIHKPGLTDQYNVLFQ